jgi:ring-1,2-phenylacetyl-CoA epoxidase subunit PaaD
MKLEKLRAYGITPEKGADEHHIGKPKKCPRCGSEHTKQIKQIRINLV